MQKSIEINGEYYDVTYDIIPEVGTTDEHGTPEMIGEIIIHEAINIHDPESEIDFQRIKQYL